MDNILVIDELPSIFMIGGYALFVVLLFTYIWATLRQKKKSGVTHRALEGEKEDLQIILNAVVDGIYVLDKDGRITMANTAAQVMFGCPLDEMIKHTQYSLIQSKHANGEDYSIEESKIYNSIHNGVVTYSEDEVFWRRGGDYFSVSYQSAPLVNDGGEIKGTVVSFQDITARKERENLLVQAKMEADKASRTKSEFLANMSHELRTPLNSILGLARMFVEDSSLDQDNKDMANIIYKSAASLLEIVNDILDISKIESGNIILENIGFDLKDTAANVIEAMAPLASAKGVSINYRYETDNIPYILGDPFRLSRVLTNLISNAVKYTEEGTVTIVFDWVEKSEGKVMINVSVIDTGIGIDKNKISSIFEKFIQADASITREYGGTGLGLAITKELVELMGGEIGVNSEVGVGSSFWFNIPFDVTDSVDQGINRTGLERRKRKREDDEMLISVRHARILVAEDHLLNQDFIRRLLSRMGFESIKLVDNGALAVEAFEKTHYDLILMDCHMPEKNGYEATKEIRKSQKSTSKSIPVIALTADAMQGTREKCLAVGMSEYIDKPIDSDEFKYILGQWISFDQKDRSSVENINGVDEMKNDGNGAPAETGEYHVDMSFLEDFAETREDLENFIDVFLKESTGSIYILSKNCVDGECLAWVEAAHKCKGGAGMMGAKKLQNLCAEAQDMAEASSAERAVAFKEIQCEYDHVQEFLHNQLKEA